MCACVLRLNNKKTGGGSDFTEKDLTEKDLTAE